jgi:two-component system chemotaxis sensor kinase CheA
MIPVRGNLIPFIRLREVFAIPGEKPSIEQIAIVQAENLRVGIVVDEIIGNLQTVIKSLGRTYRKAEGVSGATIMGDGSVSLILDIPELIRCAGQEETKFITSFRNCK